MSATVRLVIDGKNVDAPADASVAAAIAQLDVAFRRSRSGEPREPLCGMGVCFECRVRIDGMAQVRACMTPVRDGMKVDTYD